MRSRIAGALLLTAAMVVPVGLSASPAAAVGGTACTKASGAATFKPGLPKVSSTTKVKPTVTHNDLIVAPIKKGQQIGTVKMMADGKEVAQFPLVALQDVPEAGIFGRLWDSALLWWQKRK